jgi:type 1 fimbriae regulatory protein FimB/type 1 fimbriae regulatory protein FimE
VLKREAKSPFIFVSERGAPFTVSGLQKLVERAGIATKIPFKVHPHMLRHATGYVLANKGTDTRTLQSYLGHRSIQSTVRYTELAPDRFKSLWR